MSGLIATPDKIWLSVTPVDLRKGIDGLSALVVQSLGHMPCSGSAFVFRNKSCDRLKLLLWDANGVWLCQRRIHKGSFVWSKASDDSCFLITEAQWHWLIMGVDWQRLSATLLPDLLP